MSPYESPSAIIADFRISDPSEIDIEAIAQSRGATIIYEPIEGCAARILGNGDEAIITVDDGPNLERRRFSAAHEFGQRHLQNHLLNFRLRRTRALFGSLQRPVSC